MIDALDGAAAGDAALRGGEPDRAAERGAAARGVVLDDQDRLSAPSASSAQERAPARARPAAPRRGGMRAIADVTPPLRLDDALTPHQLAAVADGRRRVAIGPRAAERIGAARARLERASAQRRVIYGLTTGFGPLANRLIGPEDAEALQRNLVYHLASGVGRLTPWRAARAVTLARLNAIALGWSGASPQVVGLLTGVLNAGFAPTIPEKGTVGASGDLTPLSHLALCLMGEAPFLRADETLVAPDDAFAEMGLSPLDLSHRDGLALVNGCSAMVGHAALNAVGALRLAAWSEALTVAHAELLSGRAEAWDAAFAQARPHPGQARAAQALRARAVGAERLDRRRAADRVLPLGPEAMTDPAPLQDPYSLRCAPQVIGAARDVIGFHNEVAARELNAATDNPIFTDDAPYALHGGNFMGSHVALAADALTNAVATLAGLAERRLARLTDEKKNGGLPAFLHRGRAGLVSGFMGAQVTATALVAEIRARAGAASIQSLTTNGDNQDVVSMGTIAARGAAQALEDAERVMAIDALAVAQAVDLLSEGRAGPLGFSPSTLAVARRVRQVAPSLIGDRPLSSEIERARDLVTRAAPGRS